MTTTPGLEDLKKCVEEVTKCPICLDDIKNPKMLPCIHTFCLECIKKYSRDKLPGDDLECPVCRKGFVIPVNGVEMLPHHFFIEILVDAKKLGGGESDTSDLCDGCSDDASSTDDVPTAATMCCTFCQQKLCDRCAKPHNKLRGGLHQMVRYGSEQKVEAIKLRSSYCSKHDGNKLELYCFECDENLCVVCKISKHDSHKCQAIVDVYQDFVEILQKDSANVNEQEQRVIRQLETLERKENEYNKHVSDIEQEVQKLGDNIKIFVDYTVGKITADLDANVSQTRKNIEDVKTQLEFLLVARRSFFRYSDELVHSGNPCDVTDAYKCLHARAEELLAGNEPITLADDCKLPTINSKSDDVFENMYEFLLASSSAHKRWTEENKQNQSPAFAVALTDLKWKPGKGLDEINELAIELSERIGADDQKKQLAAEARELMAEIKQLKKLVSDQQTDKEKLANELMNKRNDMARLEQAILADQETIREKLKKEVNDYKRSVSKLEQQLTTKQADIEKFKREIADLNKKAAHQQAALSKFRKEAAENQSVVSKLTQQIENYLTDIEKLKREVAKKQLQLPGNAKLVQLSSGDKSTLSETTLEYDWYVGAGTNL